MAWNIQANKGKSLEQLTEFACGQYKSRGLARIDKIATPSKPQLGIYSEKSTVDFVGVVKGGLGVAFDCKETGRASFPLENLAEHQFEYLQDVNTLGGLAFLLVYFKRSDTYYRLEMEILTKFWCEAKTGGRKSIPEDEFKTKVQAENRYVLHFLKGLVYQAGGNI